MPDAEMNLHEDGISHGNTEDELISSKTSTETVRSEIEDDIRRWKRKSNNSYFLLTTAILLILSGIGTLIYTPHEALMDMRIRMLPGLPPFEWFMDPPDEVLLKVYVFNITNSEEFLAGEHEKLQLKEIGPIIYREKLIHTSPVFNENGTFTYTANRTPIYLPEMNDIDLNTPIIMPNLAVLLIPIYFFDAPFFTKLGVNLMMRSLDSHPFVNTTIHSFLWNITDPILNVAQNIAPTLVPTKNVGILNTVYENFVDNVTVYIGPTYDHKAFFLIDRYDGSQYLPGFDRKCNLKVANSTEGVTYPQYLTKNDTLKYWRKTLCKIGDLVYAKDVFKYGVKAYKYDLTPHTYDRSFPLEEDCYGGHPILPNGLSDLSSCYFDMSIAASFPHFLYGDEEIRNFVEGLEPDEEKHGSFVIAEPMTGIPLHGIARSQINLVIKDMKGFTTKIQRVSNIVLPMVWLEYDQVGLPWYIQWLIYFIVILMPIFQKLFTTFLFLGGTLIIYFYIRKRRHARSNLIKNKTILFESEAFLKAQNI